MLFQTRSSRKLEEMSRYIERLQARVTDLEQRESSRETQHARIMADLSDLLTRLRMQRARAVKDGIVDPPSKQEEPSVFDFRKQIGRL